MLRITKKADKVIQLIISFFSVDSLHITCYGIQTPIFSAIRIVLLDFLLLSEFNSIFFVNAVQKKKHEFCVGFNYATGTNF